MSREECAAGEKIFAGRLQPSKPGQRQDSQPDKDALGRTTTERSHGQLGIPAPRLQRHAPCPRQGPFLTTATSRAPARPRRILQAMPAALSSAKSARPGDHLRDRVILLRDAMGENRQHRRRHQSAQPAAASPGVAAKPAHCGEALARPIRQAGSAVSRGAKCSAAGITHRAFPWRQAQRAAPPARRRQGLAPDGCDSARGTGRSPQSPVAQRAEPPCCRPTPEHRSASPRAGRTPIPV